MSAPLGSGTTTLGSAKMAADWWSRQSCLPDRNIIQPTARPAKREPEFNQNRATKRRKKARNKFTTTRNTLFLCLFVFFVAIPIVRFHPYPSVKSVVLPPEKTVQEKNYKVRIVFGFLDAQVVETLSDELWHTQWALGDMNGDGKVDIIKAGGLPGGQGSLRIMHQKADGRFDTPIVMEIPGTISSMVTGDFNGDKLTDVAVADWNGSRLLIYSQGVGML